MQPTKPNSRHPQEKRESLDPKGIDRETLHNNSTDQSESVQIASAAGVESGRSRQPNKTVGTVTSDTQGTATKLTSGANQDSRPIKNNSGTDIITSSANWALTVRFFGHQGSVDCQGENQAIKIATAVNESQKPALNTAKGCNSAISVNAQTRQTKG